MKDIMIYTKPDLESGFSIISQNNTLYLSKDTTLESSYIGSFVSTFDELEVYLDKRYAIIIGKKDDELSLTLLRTDSRGEVVKWEYLYTEEDFIPDQWRARILAVFVLMDLDQGYFSLSYGYRADLDDLFSRIAEQQESVKMGSIHLRLDSGTFSFNRGRTYLTGNKLSKIDPIALMALH